MSPQSTKSDSEYSQLATLLAQFGAVQQGFADVRIAFGRMDEKVAGLVDTMKRGHEEFSRLRSEDRAENQRQFAELKATVAELKEGQDQLREEHHRRAGAYKVLQFLVGTTFLGSLAALAVLWEKMKAAMH